MLTNTQSHDSSDTSKRGETVTWGSIFSLATIGVGLLFWMGSASQAGEPLMMVAGIGLGALALSGLAAIVAVKFSRRP